ncbi:hypothetical protein, partial [Yersinia enterocolitica]
STQDRIRQLRQQLIDIQINPALKGVYFNQTGQLPDDMKKELSTLQDQLYRETKKASLEQAERNEQERQKRRNEQ